MEFDKVPDTLAIKDTRGVIRMVTERTTGRIVGVHLFAPRGEDRTNEAMYSLRTPLTIDGVIDAPTVVPTLSESFKLAVLSFLADL